LKNTIVESMIINYSSGHFLRRGDKIIVYRTNSFDPFPVGLTLIDPITELIVIDIFDIKSDVYKTIATVKEWSNTLSLT